MKRTIAFTCVVGLFLLGILVGALGMHLYYAQKFPPPGSRGGGPREMAGSFHIERLERRLGLTPDQKRRIDDILVDSRAEADAMRRELGPRVRAHAESVRERIREVLTPEQRDRFDQMRRRERRHADRFFLGR